MKSFQRFISEDTIKDKTGKNYEVRHTPPSGSASYHRYTVHDENGNKVAHADVVAAKKRVMSVGVDQEHRRKGIASALYNHIEKHQGFKLEPNWAQTPDGEALWKSRK